MPKINVQCIISRIFWYVLGIHDWLCSPHLIKIWSNPRWPPAAILKMEPLLTWLSSADDTFKIFFLIPKAAFPYVCAIPVRINLLPCIGLSRQKQTKNKIKQKQDKPKHVTCCSCCSCKFLHVCMLFSPFAFLCYITPFPFKEVHDGLPIVCRIGIMLGCY